MTAAAHLVKVVPLLPAAHLGKVVPLIPAMHLVKVMPGCLAMAQPCCRRFAWYHVVPGPRPALDPSRHPSRARPLLLYLIAHPIHPQGPSLSFRWRMLLVGVHSGSWS